MNTESNKSDFLGNLFSLTHKSLISYCLLYFAFSILPLLIIFGIFFLSGAQEFIGSPIPLIGETDTNTVQSGMEELNTQLTGYFDSWYGKLASIFSLLLFVFCSALQLHVIIRVIGLKIENNDTSLMTVIRGCFDKNLLNLISFFLFGIGVLLLFVTLFTLASQSSFILSFITLGVFLFLAAKSIIAVPLISINGATPMEGLVQSWKSIPNSKTFAILFGGLAFFTAVIIISLVTTSLNLLIGQAGVIGNIVGMALNIGTSVYFNTFLFSAITLLYYTTEPEEDEILE